MVRTADFAEQNFVPGKSICPICSRRRAERYCPAKGEKICAVDCGTEREITIDCPSSCSYLIAAHRWELEHPRPVSQDETPFPEVSFTTGFIQERREVISGLGYAVLAYAHQQRDLSDRQLFAAFTTRNLRTTRLPEGSTRLLPNLSKKKGSARPSLRRSLR